MAPDGRRRRTRVSGRKVVIGATSAGQRQPACVSCPPVPLRWVSAGVEAAGGTVEPVFAHVTYDGLRRQIANGSARRDATADIRGADVDHRLGDNAGLQSLVLRSQRGPNERACWTVNDNEADLAQ